MNNISLYPPYTVGVDLGGTNTVFAIVDSVGHILDCSDMPTTTPTVEKWADRLADNIKAMVSRHGLDGKIEGIGIGAPVPMR